MVLPENEWSTKLSSEMHTVSFSEEKKEQLVLELRKALREKSDRRSPVSEGLWHGFCMKLFEFWNGTTEIPLAAGVLVGFIIVVGVGGLVSDFLLVDPSTALLLLQTGTETVRTFNQGVSVL